MLCVCSTDNGELLSPQGGGGDDVGAQRDQQPLLKVVHGNVLGGEHTFNDIRMSANLEPEAWKSRPACWASVYGAGNMTAQ